MHYGLVPNFTILEALEKPELSGFMANRNAYAFLYLSALVMSSIFLIKDIRLKRIETICFRLLWVLLPVFLVMNASRSSLLVLVPLILYLLIKNWRCFVKNILLFMIIGCLLIPFTNTHKIKSAINNYSLFHTESIQHLKGDTNHETAKNNLYTGDRLRLQVIQDSLQLYKQNPLTGVGIGSIFEHQKQQDDRQRIAIIDNTALWIFVEMGPFGFLAFGTVFFSMLIALHRKSKSMEDFDTVFAHAMIFVMIGFGLFSLIHKILYSRFLWVFLGMSLAIPATKMHQNE